ncbi:putative mitochondrial import inner membrane translocase subunit tim13 [Dioszegia hungarica]|uniref:Mitochondrial import inner membrane translocase subunit n=1 Tax=Dioszegia hungarica TaxID=4972 RepID=A0AA38HCE9_9TREE|nr:putative mitochondrial import inner membrane translocase subunit tim13 [Dioszegia hungarica]KAI9638873.1 putative mitochondrial import inner membrane translocase subunit tim13 [Dioszegia hungarica]
MSSFFGGGAASSAGASSDMNARKEQMKQQIQQELAVANAQQLITKINENCFEKCVKSPSASLTSSEEQCLGRCMNLYMSAFDQVSRSYVARVSKERAGGMGGGL